MKRIDWEMTFKMTLMFLCILAIVADCRGIAMTRAITKSDIVVLGFNTWKLSRLIIDGL